MGVLRLRPEEQRGPLTSLGPPSPKQNQRRETPATKRRENAVTRTTTNSAPDASDRSMWTSAPAGAIKNAKQPPRRQELSRDC